MVSKEKSVRGRIADGQPNPVDVHVGNRIRLRRTVLGFSQQYLANKLGLTFQQVQKYEKGFNRVGASRLWDISRVLDVPMDFFFEDMTKSVESQSPMMLQSNADQLGITDKSFGVEADPMKKKETLELVRAYYHITNRVAAKHVFDLVLAMSKTAQADSDE